MTKATLNALRRQKLIMLTFSEIVTEDNIFSRCSYILCFARSQASFMRERSISLHHFLLSIPTHRIVYPHKIVYLHNVHLSL